jgi:thioredoxin-dependent peroxiredoxin
MFRTHHPAPALEAGDRAPDFALPGSDGRVYRLADYIGRTAVVLAWFPKAFTGG